MNTTEVRTVAVKWIKFEEKQDLWSHKLSFLRYLLITEETSNFTVEKTRYHINMTNNNINALTLRIP